MDLMNKITQEAKDSSARKSTSVFLRELVFAIVDRAVSEHYRDLYPIKCLQSSAAIQVLLDRLGIKSNLFIGATCWAKVSTDGLPEGWNGFWGDDHHVWVATEFYELVDLTISKLHLHPASLNSPQREVPAVWWGDISRWPHVIKYLPTGRAGLGLNESDLEDLELFKKRVLRIFSEIGSGDLEIPCFPGPILHGPDCLNRLHSEGHAWVNDAYFFEKHNVPLPEWIIRRELELRKQYEAKRA